MPRKTNFFRQPKQNTQPKPQGLPLCCMCDAPDGRWAEKVDGVVLNYCPACVHDELRAPARFIPNLKHPNDPSQPRNPAPCPALFRAAGTDPAAP